MTVGTLQGAGMALQSAVDEVLLGLFLGRNQTGARIRLALAAVTLGTYWFVIGLLADFPRVLPDSFLGRFPFPLDVFLDLTTSFFSPRILIHLIPVLVGLWLAFRLGVHYLTDLYEIESDHTASQYLQGAIFGWNYPFLEISSPDKELLDKNNPLLVIGGPGFLKVHLGLTTVFEGLDGAPVLFGPQGGGTFVPGFNRLREIADLRDHLLEVDEVRTMTIDGIDVYARDAQMLVRIMEPTDRSGLTVDEVLSEAYSHSEDDLFDLVYKQAVLNRSPRRWTAIPSRVLNGGIRSFVGRLPIEKFLAMAEWLQSNGTPGTDVGFIPREVLTNAIYSDPTFGLFGLQVIWVGVGTWELREQPHQSDEDKGTARTMLSAWRDLQAANRISSPESLERAESGAMGSLIRSLLEELAETWNEYSADQRCWYPFRSIRSFLLRHGLELYNDLDTSPMSNYPASLEHLRALTEIVYLGGPPPA